MANYRFVGLLLSVAGLISGNALLFWGFTQERAEGRPLLVAETGALHYRPDSLGNRIPDFSYAGYRAGELPIPAVPAKVHVPLMAGGADATAAIQHAINYVSSLPVDIDGFRGAVLLDRGVYRVAGSLRIQASGVVLRGSGMHDGGTVLLGVGGSREALIDVAGENDRTDAGKRLRITDAYVPVNALELAVEEPHLLRPGDRISVCRPASAEWIAQLGMERFGGDNNWLGWRPGEHDITWDRQVVAVEGRRIRIDAPITTAIDEQLGGGYVAPYRWPGRLTQIGIENLICLSEYDTSNPKDENHRWIAIRMEHVIDAWVRQVTFRHFAGSAVFLPETARRITVEDCKSLQPVSEVAAYRRNTFFTAGQQTLFQRLYAEYGYHDFAVGYGAAGPNVFVQCESHLPFHYSGAIGSWASGVLLDGVTVDGHRLGFPNRGPEAQGTGWTGANSVIWNCSAAQIDCDRPPGASNWAFGTWGRYAGNGEWYESDTHVRPRSLYYAQLAERIGEAARERSFLLPFSGEASSSPSPAVAAALTAEAYAPPLSLAAWIDSAAVLRPVAAPVARDMRNATLPSAGDASAQQTIAKPLVLRNGWLAVGGQVAAGRRHHVMWWRGSLRKPEVAKATPHITRFVPGRTGTGYTDDLREVVQWMEREHWIAIEHNYGLWYDRRRDDHQRVRRMDADAWAPFYELPFARSGKGTAWDGLSQYDLTQYNTWYWSRLQEFAGLATRSGRLLIHQHYFQHNVLEAGAHYADFPWRAANNVNQVGFPEPPHYAGDKRIFMDAQFYDVSHPVRRELHRAYIRQCLDNFRGQPNVLHAVGAEYTGPLAFMQFWIDVIREWAVETGWRPMVVLSATKDVQDAILADSERAAVVDVIDIRYWHYRADGSLYAPKGGMHLAPRQHARLENPGKLSAASVYRAVAEYREAFPGKAVIFSAGNHESMGWPALLAGASLVNLPSSLPEGFLAAVAEMEPDPQRQGTMVLADGRGSYVAYVGRGDEVPVNLGNGPVRVHWISPEDGTTTVTPDLVKPDNRDWMIWINRKY